MTAQPKPWIRVQDQMPPNGTLVETMIADENGVRSEALLKRDGRLWWVEGGEMYVYYIPTHWRAIG